MADDLHEPHTSEGGVDGLRDRSARFGVIRPPRLEINDRNDETSHVRTVDAAWRQSTVPAVAVDHRSTVQA